MKKRLLTVGFAGVRLKLCCPRLPYSGEKTAGSKYEYSPDCLGGAAALAAARMGIESVLLARTGNDANGSKLLSVLSDRGVDTRFVVRDRELSTALTVMVDETNAGLRMISYPGAAAALTAADVEEAFNCYPDGVLLRLEVSPEASAAVEDFAEIRNTPIYISASDIENAKDIYLPSNAEIFIGDARSVLALTGIAPANPDSSLRAAFELCRKTSAKYAVFRMNGGSIYVYDGKYARILDKVSKGHFFCDVFAPALISEFLRCGNILASAKFAEAAASLWEAGGETLETVPTEKEIRSDAHGH